ncbi:hypothetical protein Hanom_Chr03g00190151 [Helianthus anomalus]
MLMVHLIGWQSDRIAIRSSVLHRKDDTFGSSKEKEENDKDIDVEIKFNVGDLRLVLELGDSDNDPTIVPE